MSQDAPRSPAFANLGAGCEFCTHFGSDAAVGASLQ